MNTDDIVQDVLARAGMGADVPASTPSPQQQAEALELFEAYEAALSQPARAGCALSLRKSRLECSQLARLDSQLVSPTPTDEPAEKLLERIKTNHDLKSRRDARQ